MKILMTLMGLEIGGAETHVVELAKELARRGNEIVIASNGGVFEQELAEVGISHISLPLHSKKLKNFIKSYTGLKRLIKGGDFDLIHAHARIPAFICGLLHKKLKFRFITTTHWVFKTGLLLNLMTNWGERTIAVSEDIKKYLIDNYGIPAKHITVTINGIDTNKFSPETGEGGVASEFNMGTGKIRIIYVSRMDADRSAVAFNLLEIAPRLYEKYNNLEIVIVGGGNDYKRLVSKVEEINSKIGKRVAISTGSRTDINKFVAAGDIFIGVSRAALEAMSAEKPVIIAGNEGYIGTFAQDKLDISIKTNFCCRGCEMPSNERLFDDISTILDKSKQTQKVMGEYNRQTIIGRYSVIRMADDCEMAYKNLLSFNPYRQSDVLISGYYGYKNVGDDSLLQAIVKSLKMIKPNINITVLSALPNETSEIYGVQSVNRFNIFKIIRQMKRTKLLISGGGSLMQDVTSTKSLLYYLSIINLAKKCGMKVMVYANGIGPINNSKNRSLSKKILNRVNIITLRDPESQTELERLGVDEPTIKVTTDPAFSIQPSGAKRVKEIFKIEKLDKEKKYFAVSVREWKRAEANFEQKVAELCDYISEKYGMIPLFIPMQYKVDMGETNKITQKMKCKSMLLKNTYNAADLMGIISRCEIVLGMRLHFLIYAISVGVPVLGLSYDTKVESMLSYLQQSYKEDVENLELDKLKADVDEILQNKDGIKDSLNNVAKQMREKTKQDANEAVNLL